MEPSINKQKIQAMKSYKFANKLVCNLILYSLTSIITCFFFSSPFWFPSITSHLFSLLPSMVVSYCFNAKCFFVVGNLIVFILVGESILKQSSSSSDVYDEYVARSRSNHQKEMNGSAKTLIFEGKKEEIKNSIPHGEEKRKGMRSCKSEVWGESGLMKMEKNKGKKTERFFDGEKVKVGMRSSKSAVWSESEGVMKMEKAKGKKEEQSNKANTKDEEKKMGMRSSKSAVWSESETTKTENGKGKREEEMKKNDEGKKMGMRSCRSEIWSENEIVRLGKTTMVNKEEEKQLHVLNRRVEDFIARVNKQRLLEAKLVDHSKG